MPLRPGSLRLPWQRSDDDDDPYWDAFINRPPADNLNLMAEILRRAPEGAVFPTQTELHTPEITASHVKELSVYLRSVQCGIVDLAKQDPELAHGYPFGIVNLVPAEFDPYMHPGFGGQAPVQAGQYLTFIVASWIREMGFRATMKVETTREQREHLAVTAGLGTLTAAGRLTVPKHGTKVFVTDIIFTDLPMMADG
jgi:hypothetical protein